MVSKAQKEELDLVSIRSVGLGVCAMPCLQEVLAVAQSPRGEEKEREKRFAAELGEKCLPVSTSCV